MPIRKPLSVVGVNNKANTGRVGSVGIVFDGTDPISGRILNGIAITAAWIDVDFNATQSPTKLRDIRCVQYALDLGGARLAQHGSLVLYVPATGQLIYLGATAESQTAMLGVGMSLLSGIVPLVDAGSTPIFIGKLPSSDGTTYEGSVSLTFFDFDLSAYTSTPY